MEKVCKKHGPTEYRYDGKCWRCKKCRSEAVAKRRRSLKERLVEEFGGKCAICGYNRYIGSLEFHHKDPSQKKFAISGDGIVRSYEALLDEASKCMLLCRNCHGEVEAGLHSGVAQW